MSRLAIGGIVPILALLVSLGGVSHAAAQAEVGSLGIWAYACETDPPREPQDPSDVPSDCAPVVGATVTVTDASGQIAGSCATPAGGQPCVVEQLPMGATVTVTEDLATIPEGYAPIENPIVYTMPPPGTDGVFWVVFLNVRQPAEEPPADDATRLPSTGAGLATGDEAGWAVFPAVAVVLAALSGAVRLRRRAP